MLFPFLPQGRDENRVAKGEEARDMSNQKNNLSRRDVSLR
jgi:hypothetical protein